MNRFIKVDEVAEELGISKPYAYKIIRRLSEELREKGMITIAGAWIGTVEGGAKRRLAARPFGWPAA